MSTRLPSVSGARLIRALRRAGWVRERQRGSHVILSHPESDHNVVVPIHRELRRGTLNGILKDAGITTRELRRLL